MTDPSLPPSLASTRADLQRVATHVLARRRHDVTGKIGLRATAGGFGTPAFGHDVEVLRVSGTWLVRERAGEARLRSLVDRSLGELAELAEVDLDLPFEAGHDTPPVGDVDAPLAVNAEAVRVIADWFSLGSAALDAVCGSAPSPHAVQLWPEHFDVGTSVAVGEGPDDRCNLGASPGDGSHEEPYLYVGPWGPDRPGDPTYWNAPFGAVLPRAAVLATDVPAVAAADFLQRGIDLLRGG